MLTSTKRVFVTIYGKTYTGRHLGTEMNGTVRVRLDEPAVINGPGWKQNVPDGQPVKMVYAQPEWVHEGTAVMSTWAGLLIGLGAMVIVLIVAFIVQRGARQRMAQRVGRWDQWS
jgi:hypothetical protein